MSESCQDMVQVENSPSFRGKVCCCCCLIPAGGRTWSLMCESLFVVLCMASTASCSPPLLLHIQLPDERRRAACQWMYSPVHSKHTHTLHRLTSGKPFICVRCVFLCTPCKLTTATNIQAAIVIQYDNKFYSTSAMINFVCFSV